MEPTKTDHLGKLRIEDQLCFALYSTSRAITKQYSILLKELGVTYPQYLVLLVLWQEDGKSIQDIAKALEIDGATTTPLVQRMEKLGFVIRLRSENDERRVQVFLTEKSKSSFPLALEVPHGLGCATGLNHETAHQIIESMNKIKDFMNSASDKRS